MLCKNCQQDTPVPKSAIEILKKVGWIQGKELKFCPACIEKEQIASVDDMGPLIFSPRTGGLLSMGLHYRIRMRPLTTTGRGKTILIQEVL